MREVLERYEAFVNRPFFVQEYTRGKGQGIFALYNRGQPVAFFAHKRLREKPPSGGVSVLSESVELNPQMVDIATRVLNHVNWHGIAMVEFKVSPERGPFLIEINARFWGSLQLAIDAGVDFPYLLYAMACGESVEKIDAYRVGLRNRWLLGDLDHLYLRLREPNANTNFGVARASWHALREFLKFFDRDTRYEVNRWDDLGPFFVELKAYLAND
jgi:predicted ATP-grasp superfamily ATP-dependent carboligase